MLKQILFIFLGLFLISFTSALNFAGGDGTIGNPYQITNWTALNEIRDCMNCYYVLNNNLDSSTSDYAGIGNNWQPIGNATTAYNFVGNIDGQGYNISDMVIPTDGVLARGFIGYSTTGLVIKDLGLIDISVTSGYRAAAFVGQGILSLTNSFATGTITSTGASNSDTGGIIAYCGGSVAGLVNVSFTGTITHTSNIYTGGIIGRVGGATCKILNSNVQANINCGGICGGLVGQGNNIVNNSYFNGSISGTTEVGGMVGRHTGSGTYYLSYCNSSGYLSSSGSGGGAVGLKTGGTLFNLYSNMSITGSGANISGLVGSQTTAILNNSKFEGSVISSSDIVGGCVGLLNNLNGKIYRCINNATIIKGSNYVGGLVGKVQVGVVSNSYSLSPVNSTASYSGSGIGITNSGIVENIYAKGFLDCATDTYCGGLVGNTSNLSFIVNNSYWDINTTGWATSTFGVDYTTLQMKNISSFPNWSIANSTTDLNNGYPYLSWQGNETGYIWRIYVASTPTYCWTQINSWTIWYPIGCSRWRASGQ